MMYVQLFLANFRAFTFYHMKKILLLILLFYILTAFAQTKIASQRPGSKNSYSENHFENKLQTSNHILPGAYQTEEYLPLLKGKRVGIFANQTSVVEYTHLVDTLKKMGVHLTKIFAPEHGFRGTADAGAHVKTYTDEQTGIPVISL